MSEHSAETTESTTPVDSPRKPKPKQSRVTKQLPEGYRPLSDKPVIETFDSQGRPLRLDEMGRALCHAHRRDGELCKSPIVTGMRVCRMHGGSSQKAKNGAKLRLAELVNPAIATLAREMANADRSVDRQRAANSILDRSGFGRAAKVEVADAKELLYQRLLAMQEEAEESEALTPDPADMDFDLPALPRDASITDPDEETP